MNCNAFYVDPSDRIKSPQDLDIYGCQELAIAVAKLAARDWREAVKREKKSGRASHIRKECERFFKSEWFRTLTGADGKYVLAKLQKEEGV